MLAFYLSMLDDEDSKSKFEIIYNKYKDLMFIVARKYINKRFENVVEDIVQDVFVILIENIKIIRMDVESETQSFIATITKHRTLQYNKKNERVFVVDKEENSDLLFNTRTYYNETIDILYFKEVLEELEKMDEKYSTPLKLKVLGYKIEEIAVLLEIEPSNVKVRIHRARKLLAERMDKLNEK